MTPVVDVLVTASAWVPDVVGAAAGDATRWPLADVGPTERVRALVMAASDQRLDVIEQLVARPYAARCSRTVDPADGQPRGLAVRRGLVFGVLTGLAAGFESGSDTGLKHRLAVGIVVGLAFGLVFGLAFSIVAGLGLGATFDTMQAAGPQVTLIQDRTSALAVGFTAGLVVGLPFGLAFGLAGWLTGLVLGLVCGLAAGSAAGFRSAWGHLGITRLWLAWRGCQPLHLITFLQDARERGVLRQVGAVWEFRHANLQRRLASQP